MPQADSPVPILILAIIALLAGISIGVLTAPDPPPSLGVPCTAAEIMINLDQPGTYRITITEGEQPEMEAEPEMEWKPVLSWDPSATSAAEPSPRFRRVEVP